MSYILDALRRADAERQRGSVPGLNTPAVPLATGAALASGGRRRGLAMALAAALGVAVLLGLGLGLGQLWWRSAHAPASVGTPAVAAAVAPAAGSTAVTPGDPPAPAAPMPSIAPALAAAPVPPPVVLVMPAPTPPTPPVPAMPAEAPPASARLPTLAELPEALRRQVPPLALGGGMYSEQASQRLVIVNGQVAHEGSEVAPGVRLLQIRPKSVVFGVGGQRFEAAL
ncbi:general secretion pathway protein GspB [Aquabacterium sp. OR-4]|uniref:general secretion pathway protein GspB n=1 Tax=Aquabacterium sp. OR-4 TaxID=2978127 RepID=UPI0021B3FB98|nr:general secretion pathway protein GspB [Aquabacterium sp. OR-4]MDT7834555.1 general secretion pathway protein GspB [Aquabacterium sp. OR-4]